MDKEYLADYQKHEEEEIEAFHRQVVSGNFSLDTGYPPDKRFCRLREPFVEAASYESIWPQIPLSGSLLIRIAPRTEREFAIHGFEASDINRLVDFALDTGRVQFGLLAEPLDYVGLDYLNPIFKELEPPLLTGLPYWKLIEEHDLRKYEVEFETLAGIRFVPYLSTMMRQYIEGCTMNYIAKRIDDYQRDYVVLKAYGYKEIVDKLSDALASDFDEAMKLFSMYGNLLSERSLRARKCIFNMGLNELREALKEKVVEQSEISLPCEIGRFLIRKVSLFPESFQACLDIISKYRQEELEKVLHALNEAIFTRNLDLVDAKSEEISVILENVWSDAERLARATTVLRYGIPVDLAAIGALVGSIGGPLGTATGFLAGLGYGVAKEILKVGTGPLSEKIAKFGEPSYISTIFDFQKKIKIRQ